MSKLLIVGSIAFDAIETPFGKTDKILGGAAPFIGLAASTFNIPSAIVSVVGEDFPEEYLKMLQDRSIDTEAVEVVKGGKTFFWSGKYHNDLNSRDTLDTQLNVLADFNPIVPDHYKDAEIVMLGNLNPLVQLSVLEQMTVKPKLAILDTMNFWMEDMFIEDLRKVIAKVDVITINDEEARQLSGEYSLVKAARAIEKMGPNYVIIKKGEHGALLFHNEQIFFAPALPLEEVFDPTGAGDTFAGGFSGYLTKTNDISFENMKKAIIHASNLASFSVEKFGTERMQELEREEIKKRLQEFKELTQFEIELT
ncbi:PfkB family carbohydrate kinase [Aquimarina intermedia]|uniref:Sugar/nucleoside kinase (Ribokinase family) n=1 Tax=Aquimarina intermedia TaxID=350814 RepID=A0A5S5CEP6_9FLAO|nr:PfkB family carbohydrate kinase [Aquimarina intermedia]TYP76982.1 sugar/nucleoside kinase (ribokinase family) [Aquimarina intermedia]